MKVITTILLLLGLLSLVASFCTLLLAEYSNLWPFRLFHTGILLFSLCLLLEFRQITKALNRKWSATDPQSLFRASLLFLCLILVQILAYRQNVSLDWTDEALYTVSSASLKLINETPTKAVLYASPVEHSLFYTAMHRFLLGIQGRSQDLTVELVDPVKTPSRGKDEGVLALPGLMLIRDGKQTYLTEKSLLRQSPGRESEIIAEGSIIAALTRMRHQTRVQILACSGSQVFYDDSPFGFARIPALLSHLGFDPILRNDFLEVVSDLPLLLLCTDRHNQPLPNLSSLSAPALIAIEPGTQSTDPRFLVSQDLVVDPMRAMNEEGFLISPLAEPDHPLAQGLSGATVALYGAGALQFRTDVIAVPVLHSSPASWLQSKAQELTPDMNRRGPFMLMAQVGHKQVLMADTDCFTNRGSEIPGNKDLLINSLFYISSQDELMMTRAKILRARILEIPRNERIAAVIFFMILWPGFLFSLATVLFLILKQRA